MPHLHDPSLAKIFAQDREILKHTSIPIVTVAGTFAEDVKDWHGKKNENISTDIVFSRAHFSMAYAALQTIWKDTPDQKKAWLVDPTNFVSAKDWRGVQMTEDVGQLIARSPLLKTVKDIIDRFGRKKMPILGSITPPLLYLFEEVQQPILSFHIAAGNILASMGKTVVQVVTDPHVRDEYLEHANLPNLHYCVFDEETKFEALEKTFMNGMHLDPDRVIVTGPPIDQRIINLRKQKTTLNNSHPLRLLITTGGLGTNKGEIRDILDQLLPSLHTPNPQFELMLYAGTQKDFMEMGKELGKQHNVLIKTISDFNTEIPYRHAPHGRLAVRDDKDDLKSVSSLSTPEHNHLTKQPGNQLTILYHPQIFDANEILIKYGFPWADGVITKPSGDMAYDAAAAGCFLLTLKPWGVWEERIEDIFWQKGIARKAETKQIEKQLKTLSDIGWLKSAMEAARDIDPLYLGGIEKIVEVIQALHLR